MNHHWIRRRNYLGSTQQEHREFFECECCHQCRVGASVPVTKFWWHGAYKVWDGSPECPGLKRQGFWAPEFMEGIEQ